jgi:hypothetical protein
MNFFMAHDEIKSIEARKMIRSEKISARGPMKRVLFGPLLKAFYRFQKNTKAAQIFAGDDW